MQLCLSSRDTEVHLYLGTFRLVCFISPRERCPENHQTSLQRSDNYVFVIRIFEFDSISVIWTRDCTLNGRARELVCTGVKLERPCSSGLFF
jgi:hypothetical protein